MCQREHVYLNTCRGQSATSDVISEELYTFVVVVVVLSQGLLVTWGSLISQIGWLIETLGSVCSPPAMGLHTISYLVLLFVWALRIKFRSLCL